MATYYISINDGVNLVGQDGSINQPWKTYTYAESRGKVIGNTIIFKPGIYPHIFMTATPLTATPTILKSQVKWGAIIVGDSIHHGIYTGNAGLSATGGGVTIDGFEVRASEMVGIKQSFSNNVIRNCWIHHSLQQGIAGSNNHNSIIENNLIEFNGTHPQFHHGIYADGDGLIVRNNIVRHNAGYGIHLLPGLTNTLVENNLSYGNERAGIIIGTETAVNPIIVRNNRIINNTVVGNGIGISIWGCDGDIVANNIIAYNKAAGSTTIPSKNTIWDNNLQDVLQITTGVSGATNTIIADPLFVDTTKGAYFLQSGSPAATSGSFSGSTTDFWGVSRSGYIGAFPYLSGTDALTDAYYSTWPLGYSYNYPESGMNPPDFWTTPTN